jgi:Fe2+ or Zn2+ uptake regulation protein
MIPKKDSAPDRGSTRETLRARGLRLTNPRRIILDVVRATDAHPTATWVYRAVRRKLPRVSLATVYRNLRTLAAQGLLAARADVAGMRFDGKTTPHHHFTCVACGRIFDLPGGVTGARTRISSTLGFEVLSHRIEFYGRCRGCRRVGSRRSLTR